MLAIRPGDSKSNSAVSAFWRNNLRNIPEPITFSVKNNIGIYRFIDGVPLKKGTYTYHDIRAAGDFWQNIHALRIMPEAAKLSRAKEACFTVEAYLGTVDQRLRNLKKLPWGANFHDLHVFLDEEFDPFYRQVRKFVEVEFRRAGVDLAAELPAVMRTLSPSDFGFHNSLRSGNGKLVFFDFEYFGWDDPVKLISDFYLHPRMALPYKFREYFFNQIYPFLDHDPVLTVRLPLVYLLLALKWCLIMLNIFRQEIGKGKNREKSRLQLKKATNQLNETVAELEMRSFPLSLLRRL